MYVYKNSDMNNAINEYVHEAKYRELLRLRFCEGHTYEEISSMCNFSPQHIKCICRTYKDVLMSHI